MSRVVEFSFKEEEMEMYDIEEFENGAQRLKGFRLKPRSDYIFVLDFGQPNQTQSGIFLGETDGQYQIYRHEDYRYGEVIAFGPGRFGRPIGKGVGKERWRPIPPEIQIGTIVFFSKKTGTRLPANWDFISPRFPDQGPIHTRVFDPEKLIGTVEGEWKPWWNIKERQLNIEATMSG